VSKTRSTAFIEKPLSLVELFHIGLVITFDLAIHFWASSRNVAMRDTQIGKMPSELPSEESLSVWIFWIAKGKGFLTSSRNCFS
jgi:hypothetical protein